MLKIKPNTKVVMSYKDFKGYIEHREKLAQLELIEDEISPYDARRARRLVSRIKNTSSKSNPKRKNNTPRELVVRVLNTSREVNLEEVTQFLVR